MDALDDLTNQWRIAKEKEEAAKELRIFLENELLKLHKMTKQEGSESFTTPNGAKVRLTARMSYKVDIDKLAELTTGWADDARPLKTVADESKLKTIRNEAPRMWAEIAQAVTVTPAKVGVAIEFKE
jgi:hypothetical protein